MNDRQPPGEFTKAAVQGIGMIAMIIVGTLFMSGLRSGSIRPAEILAEIPIWKDTIMSYVPIVATSAAALLVSVLAAIVATRYGRAMVSSTATKWWRYERRWAEAMAAVELTGKPAKNGGTPVPVLRGVALNENSDVLTVRMLPGQTLSDWHDRAPTLAQRFGATSGRIEITASGTESDFNLILERTESGPPERKALEAPASATLPGLILDPAQAAGNLRPERAALRAWSLQIVCARLRVGDDNVPGRWWFGGRVRWNIIERHGYYLVGGA